MWFLHDNRHYNLNAAQAVNHYVDEYHKMVLDVHYADYTLTIYESELIRKLMKNIYTGVANHVV